MYLGTLPEENPQISLILDRLASLLLSLGVFSFAVGPYYPGMAALVVMIAREKGKFAMAIKSQALVPAVVKLPPAYNALPDAASAHTSLFIPEPSADQLLPSHCAM